MKKLKKVLGHITQFIPALKGGVFLLKKDNNLKTTIIYNYDSNPENIFGVNLDGFRKVSTHDGFLIDNYDYDKMVSKLNMVLNFQ